MIRPRRSAGTPRPPRLLWLLGVVVLSATTLAACGSSGPDLAATLAAVDQVDGPSTAAELGIEGSDTTTVWRATGTPTEVADAIATAEPPDERSDDAGGDVFLLYRSGTLWLTPSSDGNTAVAFYDDNDKAYNRHSPVLLTNSRWGTRVNDYRSSGGGFFSGNGFRGGGSGSGK